MMMLTNKKFRNWCVWINLATIIFLVTTISIFCTCTYVYAYNISKKERDNDEHFLSLTRDPTPDFERKAYASSTFPLFDFYAEPDGYIQIGHFLLNWGSSDTRASFKKQFDIPIGGMVIDHKRGAGQDNIKIKQMGRSYMNIHARGNERPNRYLAWGVKNANERVSRITVNNLSNKSEGLNRILK